MPAETIKKQSTLLLNKDSNQGAINQAINIIHHHFQEITHIKNHTEGIENLAAVQTAGGKALSVSHAAECLLDYKRTAKFLQAIVTLIRKKQEEHPGETIHIFYAGCGPFAPFVTMVAPLFNPKEIQFSVLEINETSLKLAKKLIAGLELTEYVEAYHKADAVTFKIPNAKKYHILFSETLDALLYRESYVPILWNMLPQVAEKCTLIPENVIIKTSLTHPQENPNVQIKEDFAGIVFDAREAVKTSDGNTACPKAFPENTVTIKKTSKYRSMIVDTEVQIYDDIKLTRGESSLSKAIEMEIIYPLSFSDVIFHYQLQPSVELKLRYQ